MSVNSFAGTITSNGSPVEAVSTSTWVTVWVYRFPPITRSSPAVTVSLSSVDPFAWLAAWDASTDDSIFTGGSFQAGVVGVRVAAQAMSAWRLAGCRRSPEPLRLVDCVPGAMVGLKRDTHRERSRDLWLSPASRIPAHTSNLKGVRWCWSHAFGYRR